jgi:hypothetical protein
MQTQLHTLTLIARVSCQGDFLLLVTVVVTSSFACSGKDWECVSMSRKQERPQPPPGAPVQIEVVSVPPEKPIVVRWLGTIEGMLVHWGKTSSVACPGESECPTAIHRGKTLWKGYVAAEFFREAQYQDWAPCVLEITERLRDQILGAVLRGTVWRLQRVVGRYGAKEVWGEQIDEINGDVLRPTFPIYPAIFRVYRTTRIAFGAAPVVPAKIELPPSSGYIPPGIFKMPGEGLEDEQDRLNAINLLRMRKGLAPYSSIEEAKADRSKCV